MLSMAPDGYTCTYHTARARRFEILWLLGPRFARIRSLHFGHILARLCSPKRRRPIPLAAILNALLWAFAARPGLRPSGVAVKMCYTERNKNMWDEMKINVKVKVWDLGCHASCKITTHESRQPRGFDPIQFRRVKRLIKSCLKTQSASEQFKISY